MRFCDLRHVIGKASGLTGFPKNSWPFQLNRYLCHEQYYSNMWFKKWNTHYSYSSSINTTTTSTTISLKVEEIEQKTIFNWLVLCQNLLVQQFNNPTFRPQSVIIVKEYTSYKGRMMKTTKINTLSNPIGKTSTA